MCSLLESAVSNSTIFLSNTSEEAVNDRLAKICVYQAIQDPGKDLKLKELKEKSSYEIDDYVMKQGWATMPGEEEPERVVADKCAKLLLDISQ